MHEKIRPLEWRERAVTEEENVDESRKRQTDRAESKKEEPLADPLLAGKEKRKRKKRRKKSDKA